MRWLPFLILAVLGIVCQTTLVPWIRISGSGPDVLFLLAVYYALWGPWPDAALAGLALGFFLDLYTLGQPGRIGLHAFCFGGAAWGIIQVRQMVVRTHPVAQILVTLFFGAAVECAAALYYIWASPDRTTVAGLAWAGLSALYTAALSPLVLWVLSRFNKLTGLKQETKPWTQWSR